MEPENGEQGKPTSSYVVQRAVEAVIEQSPAVGESRGTTGVDGVDFVVELAPWQPGALGESPDLWLDVVRVDVPQKSHRKTVIIEALEKLGVADDDLPQHYRALDADTAEVIPVTIERPPAPPAVRKVG